MTAPDSRNGETAYRATTAPAPAASIMEIQPTTPPTTDEALFGLPLPLNEVGETVELEEVLEPELDEPPEGAGTLDEDDSVTPKPEIEPLDVVELYACMRVDQSYMQRNGERHLRG